MYQLKGDWGVIDVHNNVILPFEYKFMNRGGDASDKEVIASKICYGYHLISQHNRGVDGSRFSSLTSDGVNCSEIKMSLQDIGK